MYKCFSYKDLCQQGMFMKQRMDPFKYMCLSKERKVNVKVMTTSGPCDVIFSGLKLVITKIKEAQLSRILFSVLLIYVGLYWYTSVGVFL